MQIRSVRLLCAALVLGAACATTGTALAATLVVGNRIEVRPSDIPRPTRGMLMSTVVQRFGEPVKRHPTVGNPPITRWDYAGFSVFFEKNRVIDAVVPGPKRSHPPVSTAAR